MAGGLFGQPFTINEKCIVFSILMMVVFLYCPKFENKYYRYFSLFIVFVVSYVSMAWYDYYHGCSIMPLRRGKYGITTLMKPGASKKAPSNRTTALTRARTAQVVYWSHLLLFVPLLAYTAYYGHKSGKKVYSVLFALGIFTAAYHTLRLVSSVHSRVSVMPIVIYATHLLVIAPLLLYTGYEGSRADKMVYPALAGVALLAVGFHGYKVLGN